jgi:hypothetical protein
MGANDIRHFSIAAEAIGISFKIAGPTLIGSGSIVRIGLPVTIGTDPRKFRLKSHLRGEPCKFRTGIGNGATLPIR